MNKKIHINLTTPISVIYEGEVDSIIAPGTEGYLGVLPGHTYLFTSLCAGKLTLKIDDEEKEYTIGSGYMEVHPTGAIIITETAQEL